jgi:hypothetical protein
MLHISISTEAEVARDITTFRIIVFTVFVKKY